MKKFLVWLLFVFCIALGFSRADEINLKNCKPQKFVVSGYYSPVKGQDNYYKWNYDKEVVLNWYGYRWASGKKVFNGMLAAPKSYSFGTKIYFPGYWVWEVADRWGAIVKAWVRWHAYDRIDVWMGKWDEALQKALSFGKKTVQWYICSWDEISDKEVGFDMDKFKIINNFYETSVWTIAMEKWRSDKWVAALQTYLNKLWYLDKKDITGYFGQTTESSLCEFQVDKKIIEKSHELCGYFGPSTRSVLKKIVVAKWLLNLDLEEFDISDDEENEDTEIDNSKNVLDDGMQPQIENKSDLIQEISKKVEKEYSKDKVIAKKVDKIEFRRWFPIWEKSKEVWDLQKVLVKFWFLTWDITNSYDEKTMDAVSEFQIKYWILTKDDKRLLWLFGPTTRQKFNEVINS